MKIRGMKRARVRMGLICMRPALLWPFLFNDSGKKTFLGKTGNFDGDDIIDILLEQKQTAKYLTKKLYRYFVNDTI